MLTELFFVQPETFTFNSRLPRGSHFTFVLLGFYKQGDRFIYHLVKGCPYYAENKKAGNR
jgi:hypothetical protein